MSPSFVDQIMNNPNGVVSVYFIDPEAGRWRMVEGFITGEVNISGAAYFNNAETNSGVSRINKWADAINATINQIGMGTGQFEMKSLVGSMQTWQGSDNFTFSVPMMFLALRKGDDVRSKLRDLALTTYPQVTDFKVGYKVTAPLGYKKGQAKNPEGCVGVRIGNWFRTPPIFVVRATTFSLSTETTSNGTPLYATGEIQLRAARVTSAKEVQSWLSAESFE